MNRRFKKLWQILYYTGKGFYEDGGNPRSAALTYFTLMSIVPVLAVSLGLARGFGFAPVIEQVVRDQLTEQREIAKYIIEFAYSLLDKTTGGVIAGIGLIVLLWSVYNILSNIEEALNNIWKIPNPRSWVRKITDYIAMIIICPLFFVVSSSLTIYLKTHFAEIARRAIFLEYTLIHFFPYLLTWMLFTFLYFFLPNRRIPFKYGMIGVFVAGTAYQLLQTFYISIQLKLSSFGAIYGSFAALPLFLIWLNLSWMIVLIGAELAYQVEIASWGDIPTRKDHMQAKTSARILALAVAYTIIRAFCDGQMPFTLHQLADKFGTSKKNLDDITKILMKFNLISETAYEDDKDIHFQPARDVNLITLKSIVDVFPPEKIKVDVFRDPIISYFEDKLNQYENTTEHLRENFPLSTPIVI